MTETKKTPMMIQYESMKAQYPDAFLFFRLGDFYEMFDDDALKAAQILEITLTSRNKNATNPTPMCGVPYHSADDYIKRLIEAGHKVAICEQVEDPKLTKGMVKREVVKVITPGTIMGEHVLSGKDNHYLVALHATRMPELYTICAIDVSTGEIKLTHTSELYQAMSEVQSLRPSEIVIADTFDEEVLQQFRQQVTTHYSPFAFEHVTHQTTWQLDNPTPSESAVLTLLFEYLFSVQKQSLAYIQPVQRYEFANYLQMNQYAKTQLELTRSLRTQRKKGSLLWLIDRTKTAMGGRMLQQWIEKPLLSRQALTTRHDKVDAFMRYYFERVDLVNALSNVYDLERLVTKISLGTASVRDIDQLRLSLRQIPLMNRLLAMIDSQLFAPLEAFETLQQLIDTTLADDVPATLAEGNVIRSGYDAKLDEYRDALTNGQQWLAQLQQRERERTGLKTLKVGYNKVFGYFIEMSRLQAANFEDTRYIRKQTLSNSERFITEELKQLEDVILGAQDKAAALEYELFVALREQVSQYVPQLQRLAQDIAALDVLCNFAALSEEEGYVRATLSEHSHDFYLKDSRHPAVEKLIGKAQFVPNDVVLTPEHPLLLLTGPNMSGKSTYMRQVAFCVILNQIGCFVPATTARLPLVDKIFTRIGSSDDIASGQSTFMIEMMETNHALLEATPNSLLLFDEIGRGTATFDGMALAEAILYDLAQRVGAATIFSTHYHELTGLEQRLPTLKNIHVGAVEKNGTVVFLHKLIDGPADKSYGIHVAKLAGLPTSVIQRSQLILEELERNAKWLREPNNTQMDLFDVQQEAEKEMVHPILVQLSAVDINTLTPMQALQYLAQWQEQL